MAKSFLIELGATILLKPSLHCISAECQF